MLRMKGRGIGPLLKSPPQSLGVSPEPYGKPFLMWERHTVCVCGGQGPLLRCLRVWVQAAPSVHTDTSEHAA